MKKLICMVMAVLLLVSLSAAAFADSGIGVEPGQHMADFTVSLTGGTISPDEAVSSALGYVALSRGEIDFLKRAELNGQAYDIKFYKGGTAYSFSVDAESGAVIAYSRDFA